MSGYWAWIGPQGRREGVGHHQLAADLGEQPDQGGADLAHAHDGDGAAGEVVGLPKEARHRPHGGPDAESGLGRGVARAPLLHRHADDPAGLPPDHVHVLGVGADVLGGDVAALQRVDHPAVGAPQALRLAFARVADEDRLAAPQVEAGGGRLQGHPLREAQHVLECLGLGRVREKASPAEGGTESRGVDGDDGPEPRGGVVAEDQFLVAPATYCFEYPQRRAPFTRRERTLPPPYQKAGQFTRGLGPCRR